MGQSDRCQIRCLTAERDKLAAEVAEWRKAALLSLAGLVPTPEKCYQPHEHDRFLSDANRLRSKRLNPRRPRSHHRGWEVVPGCRPATEKGD